MRNLLLFLLTVLLVSCGNSVATGPDDGGSTLEVIAFGGSIGISPTEMSVTARSVVMTVHGDSIVHEVTTVTENGGFVFDSLPLGTYQISSLEDSRGFSERFELSVDTIVELELKPTVTLMGRVFTESNSSTGNITVSLPGTEIGEQVDSEGFYILKNVPTGNQILAITDGARVNYLTVNLDSTDIAYLRDIRMVSDTGEVVSVFTPYPSTEERTLAVVPQFYSEENEPAWYEGREFSTVEYFISSDERVELYHPAPKQILFVGRFTVDDQIMIERLISRGYTITYRSNGAVSENDTLGIDLIYTSYSLNSSTVGSMFLESSLPIIVNESSYARKLDMASTSGQITGTDIDIVVADSPITEGLSGTIAVASEFATMEVSQIGSHATVIATESGGGNRSLIYLYEKGDSLITDIATGRRIGFFASAGIAQNMTKDGWLLFDKTIEYALKQ